MTIPSTHLDRSISRVRRAVKAVGKKPLALRAGVNHGVLRRLDDPDFSPHARKLRELEKAAIAVNREKRAGAR